LKRPNPGSVYIPAALALALTVFMVLYPEPAFRSATEGLKVWWDIVFPALLPFFIGAEILMGLGVVHFMGVLLEPLMRPLFNVPGTGSFVMAMGLASGYPIGSVLTARIRRQGLCNKYEAERLVSFTNTADPLFMSGAVAVGMFGLPGLAGSIMASHYLSSLSVGLVLRFYKPLEDRTPNPRGKGWLVLRALRAMREAREKDGRPLGQLMGDAVKNSVQTLLVIGGFIILFSVVLRILTLAGAVGALGTVFAHILEPLGLDLDMCEALIKGFFEITIGTQAAGQAQAPLMDRTMIAGAIIAWSGLSVHAQVAAMVQGTDIDLKPYILARLLHAVLAALYTWILWGVLGVSLPASRWLGATPMSWIAALRGAGLLFLLVTAGLFVLCLGFSALRGLRIIRFRP